MREARRDEPTEQFGPYVLYECLGRGGMATVHRAKKQGIEGFERPVALKRMLPWLSADGDFVKSFVREAREQSFIPIPYGAPCSLTFVRRTAALPSKTTKC